MEFGKTFMGGELGEAGDLAELSPDYILGYLGFMLAWDRKSSYQVPCLLALLMGGRTLTIDYWKPFKDWQG